jgi:hypothetical protein
MEEKRGGRPFVFATTATAHEIIAIHGGRAVLTGSECELLLDPARLVNNVLEHAGPPPGWPTPRCGSA